MWKSRSNIQKDQKKKLINVDLFVMHKMGGIELINGVHKKLTTTITDNNI